ncbi:hypothetical protein B23_2619 [Geobacillus thermoleovorans B23]|nr:hypothetical protein B23_2619 [Geobacillus thermoleovorans B23]
MRAASLLQNHKMKGGCFAVAFHFVILTLLE